MSWTHTERPLPGVEVATDTLTGLERTTNQRDVFINQDLFTNGSGRRQTWFEVDGSNALDAWGRQTIFTNIPLDAVDEMTVLTNAFSAEYGFTAGQLPARELQFSANLVF